MLKLYSHFRSSASYRVRIALNLKGLAYEYQAVNLRGGEQHGEQFRKVNPQGLVPALADGPLIIGQSLAIIEYLEERWPKPPLLPPDPGERARVRGLADLVACEIHPLNNLRVLQHVRSAFGLDDAGVTRWYHHWLREGFSLLEAQLASHPATGGFCHGATPTLADIFLVPQVANAQRYKFDMSPYPAISRINAACLELEAFRKAAPQNQPDAES